MRVIFLHFAQGRVNRPVVVVSTLAEVNRWKQTMLVHRLVSETPGQVPLDFPVDRILEPVREG
jgi:hypothetical protein